MRIQISRYFDIYAFQAFDTVNIVFACVILEHTDLQWRHDLPILQRRVHIERL